ncbi:MAG: energy transducer TonB [Acidobacteria bacterium]|nr:energy transducer TonB [Acidobacteriota bacterium]
MSRPALPFFGKNLCPTRRNSSCRPRSSRGAPRTRARGRACAPRPWRGSRARRRSPPAPTPTRSRPSRRASRRALTPRAGPAGRPRRARPSRAAKLYFHVYAKERPDSSGAATRKPIPNFTEEARRNDVRGRVRLRAVLASDGAVRHVLVLEGLPFGMSEECVAAAKGIRFTPAVKDGRPVAQFVMLEYNFNAY